MSDSPAPFDPALLNPPWPLFEQLREHAPVFEVPGMDAWLITRYEDVQKIVLDPKTFSSELEFGTGLSFGPSTPEKEARTRWFSTIWSAMPSPSRSRE